MSLREILDKLRYAVSQVQDRWAQARIRPELVEKTFPSKEVFERYAQEPEAAGLIDHLETQQAAFHRTVEGQTVRGKAYGFGAVDLETSTNLYALVRHHRPEALVETGVCNGVSTAFLLLALEKNGTGHLHSIDFPEIAGETYDEAAFWEGKGGAVIPPGRRPGWVIPDDLRKRWTLIEGKSQEELEPLLDELGTIDLFMHDSEHSASCMRFEYDAAWEHLAEDGLLVSDDVTWNDVFETFARKVDREIVWLGTDTAYLQPPDVSEEVDEAL